MTEHPTRIIEADAALLDQIQHSMFAYNGNFIDHHTTINQRIDGESSSNQHHHHQNRRQQQQQDRSISTYDYLYLQWKEAIGNLSWKDITDTKDTTTDAPRGITSVASSHDSYILCNNEASYFDMWFQKLWEMHTSYTTRYYHTVVHLEEMCFYLQLLSTTKKPTTIEENEPLSSENNNGTTTLVTHPEDEVDGSNVLEGVEIHLPIKSLLILSIFFHDAIYDVHSSTNEEDSAALFQESFAKHTDLHPTNVRLVVSYILATKHHAVSDSTITTLRTVDKGNNFPYDPLHIFLDLDMSVLGKVPMAYHQYSILIRKEYAFVPPATYCSKRADILDLFLTQSKRIFQTAIFYDAFEQRARCNVQQEIQLLRQGNIPS